MKYIPCDSCHSSPLLFVKEHLLYSITERKLVLEVVALADKTRDAYNILTALQSEISKIKGTVDAPQGVQTRALSDSGILLPT